MILQCKVRARRSRLPGDRKRERRRRQSTHTIQCAASFARIGAPPSPSSRRRPFHANLILGLKLGRRRRRRHLTLAARFALDAPVGCPYIEEPARPNARQLAYSLKGATTNRNRRAR